MNMYCTVLYCTYTRIEHIFRKTRVEERKKLLLGSLFFSFDRVLIAIVSETNLSQQIVSSLLQPIEPEVFPGGAEEICSKIK